MNVLVIGASGYVGSGICKALAGAHSVVGAARSPRAHETILARGAAVVAADAKDPASLTRAAADVDAVVYAIQVDDADAFEVDRAALQALVNALSASGKALLYTSGCWYYGDTGESPVDEDAPPNPPALVARRPELEAIVLGAAAKDVRAVVIRPALLYGNGGGIPNMLVESARSSGAARYVGDGRNHWPVVHVDDCGELYRRALEHAKPGDVFNAGDTTAFSVQQIAQAASRGAGAKGETASWPIEQAREALGPFADALALDQHISSQRAETALGWKPRSSTILDDLAGGYG